ncbi:HutD-family protein [Streptomyces sp. CB01635]|uniref:HutD/Ves family protein n=1 Tax=unclassified Streptomyces TaxID=2593676 RepID=UPI000C27EC99|nr:HutD family protein [Streptomyces sp. CB01635]PJN12688.1 HutD-family protein [Streptomyces sp. CB01635]
MPGTTDNGVRLLPAAERTAAAWKNGGGVTRNIAASPPDAGTDDFVWRVSLADVAGDGPFSAFPDVDRTLTMVEGVGMELTVGDDHRTVDERYVPQDFRGDVPTDCRLIDGPVVNFNVMWRRGAGTPPAVAVVRGRLTFTGKALVVALDGEGANVGGHELARYDAALVTSSTAAVALHARGRTAVVTFS